MLSGELQYRAKKLQAEQKERVERERQRIEKERLLQARQRQREQAREEEKRQKKLQELAAKQAVRILQGCNAAACILALCARSAPRGAQRRFNIPSA